VVTKKWGISILKRVNFRLSNIRRNLTAKKGNEIRHQHKLLFLITMSKLFWNILTLKYSNVIAERKYM